jgi:hypothetical protein
MKLDKIRRNWTKLNETLQRFLNKTLLLLIAAVWAAGQALEAFHSKQEVPLFVVGTSGFAHYPGTDLIILFLLCLMLFGPVFLNIS